MTSFVTLALVIIGFYWIVRFFSRMLGGGVGSRYRAYRQLASRYQGVAEARGLVDPPTVTFRHEGAVVRVGLAPVLAGQPSPPRTRVKVEFLRGLPLRLELFPRRRPVPAQTPRGTREVAIDGSEFDSQYTVQANDPEIVRHFLRDPDARTALDVLKQLCPPDGMHVSVNPERLLVQVDRDLGMAFPALDAMVRSSLYLKQGLIRSVEAGISVGIDVVSAEDNAAEASGPPVCEVCGHPIVGAHVRCESCKTPCHSDCWSFFGGCSTFGCQGKKNIAVRAR